MSKEQQDALDALNEQYITGKFREPRYGETFQTKGMEPYDTPFRLKSWEREKKEMRKIKAPIEFDEDLS